MNRSKAALWLGAFSGFHRPGVDEVRRLDAVSRFLYSARSVILVVSAQAAIIGGLLAAADRRFDSLAFALVLVGFVVAHVISNLSNDYFGWKRGHDTPDSPRMRYTVHPLAGGTLEPRVLIGGLVVLSALGAAIAAYFVMERGARGEPRRARPRLRAERVLIARGLLTPFAAVVVLALPRAARASSAYFGASFGLP